MFLPDNVHMSNIMETETVICRNIHVYTYMHIATINEKGHDCERGQRIIYESF